MKYIMKLIIFIIFFIHTGYSAPVTCKGCDKDQHCLTLTSETEQEINDIISKLTDYLNDLAVEHEDFDITLLKIEIEKHSDDEEEEKDVKLQVHVNDCSQIEIDYSIANTTANGNDGDNIDNKKSNVDDKIENDSEKHDKINYNDPQTDNDKKDNPKNNFNTENIDENDNEQNSGDNKKKDVSKTNDETNLIENDDLDMDCEEYNVGESGEEEKTKTEFVDFDDLDCEDTTEPSAPQIKSKGNPLADLILNNNPENDINNGDSSKYTTDSEQKNTENNDKEKIDNTSEPVTENDEKEDINSTELAIYSEDNKITEEYKKPEIMILDLPQDVEDLLFMLEKKRGKKNPFLVYVEKNEDENKYVLLD